MMFEMSARVSEIIPHRDGQGEPPKVILMAISSILSNTVKLSVAVSAARVQRWKAASISTLQMKIFV
jgi:hypothetical protein